MKIQIYKILCLSLFTLFILSGYSPSSYAAAAKFNPANVGPVAIVWRGQDFVGSNYFSLKNNSINTGLLFGLGGVLGSSLGAGAKPQIYMTPNVSKKGGALDAEKEKVLATLLEGFDYQSQAKEMLKSRVLNGYQIVKYIDDVDSQGFPQGDKKFYKKSAQYFYRIYTDPIYDYSSLKAQGVKTVIEIYPQAFMAARTGLSGEATPCFAIRAHFIDLTKNEIMGVIFVSKLAPSESTKEFEDHLKNPAAIKSDVLALMPQAVEKFSKKLLGKKDDDDKE